MIPNSVRIPLAEAGLWLVAGRSRGDVATRLLLALGLMERAVPADPGPADPAPVRDHLVEAVLWLTAGRPRPQVARALLAALSVEDGQPASSALPCTPPADWWVQRLHAWDRWGGASPLTGLSDWLLHSAIHPDPPLAPDVVVGALSAVEPEPDEACLWSLALEVNNGASRTVVPATDFRAVERDVRWVSGTTGLLGMVGGRPLRATGGLIYERRAVRYRWVREEVLLPFGTLRIREAAA